MGMLYAGTSGFAYKEWKPAFYPADVPQKRFLEHYARRLNSVEINYTFRRNPVASTLTSWFEQTEAGFLFAIKAHQRITHIHRLKGAENALEFFLKSIDPLRSARRLGPLLFQLPPNLKRDDALLVDFLALLPGDLRATFEFRHDSWFDDAVYTALADRGAALCLAESEKLRVPEIVTAGFVYWRLRMPEYSPADLDTIRGKCRELIDGGKEVFVYFKHEESPDGALWAERILTG